MASRSVLYGPKNAHKEGARSPQRIQAAVLLFFIIGLGLRIARLDLKTAWMDEVSTVIFSLGNSSFHLPLEKIVDLETILRPITYNEIATPMDSARYLLQENNHPPAYFMLAHLWMDLFSQSGEAASLAVSRTFSALLGSLSIPAVFWVANNAFRSPLAGAISAAFMAVSPFSLFLSQEARHYGLAITLTTLSLGCFIVAARAVLEHKSPSWRIVIGWIFLNALAFSNHYFSALTLTAEGVVFTGIAYHQTKQENVSILWQPHWRSIYLVAVSTAVSILIWLPILLNFHGSPQTTFLRENGALMKFINPIAQTFAALMTSFITPANFFAQTPLQIALIVTSILLSLLFMTRLLTVLIKGGKYLYQQPEGRVGLLLVGGFGLAMLSIFAVICYGYGSDITRGLRYKFTYYPVFIIIAGGIFALYWPARSRRGPFSLGLPGMRQRLSGRQFVQVVWIAGLLSSLMIVNNFAFPKYYAPDRFIPFVQANSSYSIVMASTEKIFEQPTVIGAKFLSIAWEIERHFPLENPDSGWQAAPKFFALQQGYGVDEPLTTSFAKIVNQLLQPVDLWMIRSEIDENDPLIMQMPPSCQLAPQAPQGNKGGYLYIHFQCGLKL